MVSMLSGFLLGGEDCVFCIWSLVFGWLLYIEKSFIFFVVCICWLVFMCKYSMGCSFKC